MSGWRSEQAWPPEVLNIPGNFPLLGRNWFKLSWS